MADPIVLNPETLKAFRESLGTEGGEVFTTVLRLFIGDAPCLVTSLQKGVKEDDLPTAQWAAHTLRSNCDTLGALELARLCRDMETSCRQGDRSRWAEQLGAIETLFPQVLQAVKVELDRSLPGDGV